MDETKILNEIKQINIYKSIISSSAGGIMDLDGAVINEIMTKKERSLINEYIKQKHITSDGTPRQIKPPSGSIKGWSTRVAGKKRITASTEELLMKKLFDYYSGNQSTSFKSIFFEVLDEISATKSVNTIKKYKQDYNRFISGALGNKIISSIDSTFLKKYTADMLKKLNPPKKSYLGYKGLLNMTFKKAISKGLINHNPVGDLDNQDFYPLCHDEIRTPQQKAMSPEQIEAITKEVRRRMQYPKKYGVCYTLGYMFLFSKNTGVRSAELCSLKQTDITEYGIHIHSQQLKDKETKTYYYAPWTKDEKRVPRGGRYYPITEEIDILLKEIREAQKKAGIESEWLFANKDGSWILADIQYESFLHKICSSLGYTLTNNHAIRMYVNSYVLVPNDIKTPNRARLLGHSEAVNSKYYTFEDYDYCESTRKALNRKKIDNPQ